MSNPITFDVSAVDALIRDLTALMGDLSPLAEAAKAGGELVRFDGRNYPSEPAGSTYTRTYVLRDGWAEVDVDVGPSAIIASTFNAVDYAEFVYGPNQAPVHSGRWPTEEALATGNEAEAAALMEQGASAWLGAYGL
jgi:hypothetical protein